MAVKSGSSATNGSSADFTGSEISTNWNFGWRHFKKEEEKKERHTTYNYSQIKHKNLVFNLPLQVGLLLWRHLPEGGSTLDYNTSFTQTFYFVHK